MELGVLLTANVSMLGCCACVTYQTSSVLKSSTGCVEIEIHDLPGHVPCVRHGPSENLKSLLLCLGNESSHSQAYSYLTFNYHLQQTNPIKSSKHTVLSPVLRAKLGITGVVVDLPNCLKCL